MASNAELADWFLNTHDPQAWFRQENDGFYSIATDKVDQLTEDLLDFIANVIAGILNAGSERDAVNENEELADAIRAELKGWITEA